MLQVVNFLVKHHVCITKYHSYSSYRNQRKKTTIIAQKPWSCVGFLCTCWVSCVAQAKWFEFAVFLWSMHIQPPPAPTLPDYHPHPTSLRFFLGLAASLLLRRSHFIALTRGLRKWSIKKGKVSGYHLLYCHNPGNLTNLLSNPLLPTVMFLLTILLVFTCIHHRFW